MRVRGLAVLQGADLGVASGKDHEPPITFQAEVFPECRPDQSDALGAGPLDAPVFSSFVRFCANAVDHHHDERAIIHIQPVGAADELIGAVSYEWAVDVLAQVWLVKSCHDVCSDLSIASYSISLSVASSTGRCLGYYDTGPIMLVAAFVILAVVVLLGSVLAVLNLRTEGRASPPWSLAALHGLLGIGDGPEAVGLGYRLRERRGFFHFKLA